LKRLVLVLVICVAVPAPLMVLLLAPFAALSGGMTSATAPSAMALADVPAPLLALYQQAAGRCVAPWTVLAAVGKVESDHGRSELPGVVEGVNPAGAAGPMQFGIGGRAGNTWGGDAVRKVPPELRHGVDGNGDGVASVYDPGDAIPAAARYLCDLGVERDARLALAAYNAGPGRLQAGLAYADRVLAVAASYAEPVTAQAAGAGGWGGQANGRIVLDALCLIGEGGGHRLRCDAPGAFEQLDAAYRARFGVPVSITSSYRTYDDQVRLKQSWCDRGACGMAATPGHSNHGWGLALDLGGGVNDFGTSEHEWMQANAPAFGWHHPGWARQGGGKEEPWHWEYGGEGTGR